MNKNMFNKDKIKEEFRKKFGDALDFDDERSDWVENEIANFFSAQYEKLIEEVLEKATKQEHENIRANSLVDVWNSCLSTIRTSLQERGIKIK